MCLRVTENFEIVVNEIVTSFKTLLIGNLNLAKI